VVWPSKLPVNFRMCSLRPRALARRCFRVHAQESGQAEFSCRPRNWSAVVVGQQELAVGLQLPGPEKVVPGMLGDGDATGAEGRIEWPPAES